MSLDTHYIKDIIQTILIKKFGDGPKTKIIEKKDHLQFACPICGDSNKNIYKKRAKFFYNSLKLYCYHVQCMATLTQLCNKNNISIDPDKKMEMFKFIDSQITYNKNETDNYIIENLDLNITLPQVLDTFNSGAFSLTCLEPVTYNSKIYNYLIKERMINRNIATKHIYQGKYKITNKWYDDVVVFINKYNDYVFSLQIRNLKKDKSRLFKIYNFTELYEKIHGNKPDETSAIPYNKIGYYFNVFNVNYDRPVTVFEGYLDSLFMRNSIGAVGTNTDLTFFYNSDIDKRFFFDNDNAGHRKNRELLLKGEKVFLWEKLFNDYAKLTGDYYTNIQSLRNIKDLNQLAIVSGSEDPETTLNLNNYFSKDKYDIMWIPSIKKEVHKKDTNYNWDTLKLSLTL